MTRDGTIGMPPPSGMRVLPVGAKMGTGMARDWSDRNKKAFERNAVEFFIELTGMDVRSIAAGEEPDFVVALGAERVGLEVVQLTHEGIQQAHATAAHMAKPLVEVVGRTGRCLLVVMYTQENFTGFDSHEARTRFVRNAAKLIEQAAAILPSAPAEEPVSDEDHSEDFFLANSDRCAEEGLSELHLVQISTRPKLLGTAVEILPVLTYMAGDHALIRTRVSQKEAKLPAYVRNTGLPRQWLLLVTGVVGAQPVVSDMVGPIDLATGFERVYLLDVTYGTVTALSNRAPRTT